jgi:uncharacterized metal-binding protein YceD (DUF177 family)
MRGSVMKPDAISLESVPGEPLRVEAELPVPVATIDREPLLALSPLKLAGEVSRIEGGYALSARLSYDGQLECSRCLAPYAFEQDEEFTLVLYPRAGALEADVELAKGDLDTQYYDEPVIALSPIAEARARRSP